MLEDEGVADVVDVGECQLDLFPLDTDLLSLELDSSFKVASKKHKTMKIDSVAYIACPHLMMAAERFGHRSTPYVGLTNRDLCC